MEARNLGNCDAERDLALIETAMCLSCDMAAKKANAILGLYTQVPYFVVLCLTLGQLLSV